MNKLWKTAEMRRFKGFSCTLTRWLVDELSGVIVHKWSFQPVNFSSFPGVFPLLLPQRSIHKKCYKKIVSF
jgi:hypothetical protein